MKSRGNSLNIMIIMVNLLHTNKKDTEFEDFTSNPMPFSFLKTEPLGFKGLQTNCDGCEPYRSKITTDIRGIGME